MSKIEGQTEDNTGTKRRSGHGQSQVYQRSDGRWAAQLELGYVDGRRRRKTVYGATQREVTRALTRLRADHQDGKPIPSDKKTVESFLTAWLESRKPSLAPKTYVGYEQNIRVHLIPGLGKIKLNQLDPQTVDRFLKRKLTDGLSPRSVQYLRAVLRAALAQALRWGDVSRNVAALTDAPKLRPFKVQPLTPDQVKVFLDGVRDDRLEALYVVGVSTGLRQGEILGLRWLDIDLEKERLSVNQTLQRINNQAVFGTPKTEKSQRRLALPTFAVQALRAHKVRQLEERMIAGALWQDAGLVFTTPTGAPMNDRSLTHRFQKTMKQLGLPRQRFHDLRHCCASLLLAQGLDLHAVMATLGHSSIALTAGTYGHIYDQRRQEAADVMDDLLGVR